MARAWSAMTRIETESSSFAPYLFPASFSTARMIFWNRSVS